MDDRGAEILDELKQKLDYATRGPVTTREWRSYPYIFNLPKRNWKGVQILDVGTGNKYYDPDNTFPGAVIYGVDPEFSEDTYRGRIERNSAHTTRRGVAQILPVDSNKFDYILSSHAVTEHIYPVDRPLAISEMIRVMKPTGEIRLAPCVLSSIYSEIQALEECGFEVDLSQEGTDGTVAIIRLGEKIRNMKDPEAQIAEKVKAWRAFHDSVASHDRLREDTKE